MRTFLIAIVVFALGAGAAVAFISLARPSSNPQSSAPHADDHAGHDHGHGAQGAASGPKCDKHGIPKAACGFCDSSLIESLGFCHGHGVPEAFCTRCSPVVIPAFKIEGDWCEKHGLPESQCAICLAKAPGVPDTPGGSDTAVKGSPPQGSQASSGSPSAAPASHSAAPSSQSALRAQRPPSEDCAVGREIVGFESAAIARRAGLSYAPAERRTVAQTIECMATVTFNENRLAHITPRAPGIVQRVNAELGDEVEAGDVLAVIDSIELGSAKAELLQTAAIANLREKDHERQVTLAESGVTAQRALLEAQTSLAEARIAQSRASQKLRNLGLSTQQVDEVLVSEDTSPLLAVVAPFAGTVVDRHAVLGEAVDMTSTMFTVADTGTMWAMLDVYESNIRAIKRDQEIALAVHALAGETFAGQITWVASQLDPHTRTLKARAQVDNTDGWLRANMVGRAVVKARPEQESVVIPAAALQWDGCCNLVFVKLDDARFQPRKVTVAFEIANEAVIADGLQGGETVVAEGSFLLKTQLLKDRIGAGCCEPAPGSR